MVGSLSAKVFAILASDARGLGHDGVPTAPPTTTTTTEASEEGEGEGEGEGAE